MPQSIELVVRESGSVWPEWLNHSPEGDRVVISGEDAADDGPESDLSFRVRRVLARLTREGKRVRRAVVLIGTGADNPYFDSRRMLSRDVVSHMAPDSGSELLIAACATPEAQDKLLSLVGSLSDLLAGTHIDVAVRFSAPAADPLEKSGVKSTRPAPFERLHRVK
ncbi:MAG: hypothetical protein HS104_39830 [Polyangiaceae bacterium]|nr:hypothetical protein [Polyangiaceae bacterium]MCE7888872.1 hypothetical protein [Sorangiineae bacterium PRO1]MCL4749470.1 hypothetical protein [Myxococcales bacterium]